MNRFKLLRRPVVVLLTLPAGIAVFLCALPFVIVTLERHFARGVASPFVLQFSESSARTLLSVVAGGAMTALSLTYSLVLVVFTLAAGNIGPRLLQRFTSEPVNQVTAGILGGTFLYALTSLMFVQPDFVPKFTAAGAGALAIASVVQLIYFVRHVSRSVSIDSEIADISSRLTDQLAVHVPAGSNNEGVFNGDASFDRAIKVRRAGYLSLPDAGRLCDIAAKHNLRIRLDHAPGDFVMTNSPVAACDRDIGSEVEDDIIDAISVTGSRQDDGAPQFSVNLLVEIALRALSPGVNDTFTAIAATNSLSESLSRIRSAKAGGTIYTDGHGDARLYVPAQGFKQLAGQCFHPLRRAAAGNVLMCQALARALSRLSAAQDGDDNRVVEQHVQLLMRSVRDNVPYPEDIESVEEFLSERLQTAVDGRAGGKKK